MFMKKRGIGREEPYLLQMVLFLSLPPLKNLAPKCIREGGEGLRALGKEIRTTLRILLLSSLRMLSVLLAVGKVLACEAIRDLNTFLLPLQQPLFRRTLGLTFALNLAVLAILVLSIPLAVLDGIPFVAATCSAPAKNSDWAVQCWENCTVSADTDIGTGTLIFNETDGYFQIKTNVELAIGGLVLSGPRCAIVLEDSAKIKINN